MHYDVVLLEEQQTKLIKQITTMFHLKELLDPLYLTI